MISGICLARPESRCPATPLNLSEGVGLGLDDAIEGVPQVGQPRRHAAGHRLVEGDGHHLAVLTENAAQPDLPAEGGRRADRVQFEDAHPFLLG